MTAYRREIDGLRALAVLPVILFHAGYGAFSGGFAGVDVFFVISGCLITSIILADIRAGNFSLINFYERRARRILPALFLVMFACVPFAWLWLLPSDMKGFSDSLVAVSAFASNMLFWRESGYFDTAAELKPLLHTWSLAVEEQYYVLFPLFLMIVLRLGKRWAAYSLSIVLFVSLLVAHWGSLNSPAGAFFLLPTRAWELLIGSLIAYCVAERRGAGLSESGVQTAHRLVGEMAGIVGVVFIVYAVLAFDKKTPFPGAYALVPTIGAALIMLFATPATVVGKILGSKALVGVGRISYSAYLWHQPIFAFARQRSLEEPDPLLMLALSGVSMALAYLSWRFVETPFRNKRTMSRRVVFGGALCCTMAVAALGFAGHLTGGFEQRFAMPDDLKGSFARTARENECFDKAGIHTVDDWTCRLGSDSKLPSFLVFGDSHSLSVLDVFDKAARQEEMAGLFTGASGCAPLMGIYSLRPDQGIRDCHALNQRVFDYVKNRGIRTVYFVARWTYYTDGGYGGDDFSYLGRSSNDVRSRERSRAVFEEGVERTVRAYAALGVKAVFIGQVPQQRHKPQTVYYRALSNGSIDPDRLSKLSVGVDEHMRLQKFVTETFRKHGQLKTVSFDDLFCREGTCLIGDGTGSYYFDDNHLSVYGGARLLEAVRQQLRH